MALVGAPFKARQFVLKESKLSYKQLSKSEDGSEIPET